MQSDASLRRNLELADSVLEVSISANRKIVEEFIGDESMYEVLNPCPPC